MTRDQRALRMSHEFTHLNNDIPVHRCEVQRTTMTYLPYNEFVRILTSEYVVDVTDVGKSNDLGRP